MIRLINTHSVLFGNVARLNLQFDVLDLNTGLTLVITENAARWNFQFDMGKQRRPNTYTVSIREHACSVSCRFCVLDKGFALV